MSSEEVLDKIVAQDGDCLIASLCSNCPFANECLYKFIVGVPTTKNGRLAMALDAIVRKEIVLDGD